jgi:hypothetical protein
MTLPRPSVAMVLERGFAVLGQSAAGHGKDKWRR